MGEGGGGEEGYGEVGDGGGGVRGCKVGWESNGQ